MVNYKYNQVEDIFTEDGHTMLKFDILKRLERLAYLENRLKTGNLVAAEDTGGKLKVLDLETNTVHDFCHFDDDRVVMCNPEYGHTSNVLKNVRLFQV